MGCFSLSAYMVVYDLRFGRRLKITAFELPRDWANGAKSQIIGSTDKDSSGAMPIVVWAMVYIVR